MSRRVVVTGVGMITPVGHTAPESWQQLVAGCSGTGPITLFDPEGYDSRVAGEVTGFQPEERLERRELRRMDRFTQFAAVATDEALAQSGLEITEANSGRTAVIIGSALGGVTTFFNEHDKLRQKGPGRVSPFVLPMALADMASGQLSIRLGTRGVNYCLVSACASGADAIGEAANIIRRGDADIAIAGGAEAGIIPIVVAGFSSARALTERNDEPHAASSPFDARRDGFVIAEGAGVLILEAEETASARGANILAEMAGYGATSDAFHVTQPHETGEGAARALHQALAEADLRPDDVDYINAHGTSTPMNDKFETLAIKRVFGDHAYDVAVSSTKSMTGHMLGAGGAVEAGICVMALLEQTIPPTANYRDPDPDCDLDYVPNTARPATLNVAMSNAFGFGGHNSSLVFRRHGG